MPLHTTLDEDASRATAGRAAATHLVLCLEAQRPLAGSALCDLAGVNAVVIGRGERREVVDETDDAGPVRVIRVPDQRMSRRHLRLERVMGRWIFKDLGSRNGTAVDGERAAEGGLRDGSLIEVGRSFLELRHTDDELTSAPTDMPTLVPAFSNDLAALERVARTSLEVLLLGESGTGKEVAARWAHRASGRTGPFVAVNCGAVPGNLVESELFGVRHGAFSGANEDREGWVRAAQGGTLFLDEIAELPLSSQAALLRVLQERCVVPVGGTEAVPVDFRLMAATHTDLAERVAAGKFRDDLYSRVVGFTLTLPPLRQRRVDMGTLIASLLLRVAPDAANTTSLSLDAARALMQCRWPHNVRQLEKCLAVAVALAEGGRVELDHLPPAVRDGDATEQLAPSTPLGVVDAARRDEIVALLAQEGGNVSAVAREMGKARTQIVRWIARYQIDIERARTLRDD